MKRGSIPLWLLRDLPALIGIAWSFWPLMIMVISSARRAMLGKKISPRIYECIMHMLPIAEAHLHYALCRQAWRALGWNVREGRLETFPPITDWSQLAKRFDFYRTQMMDLRAAATDFTEGLREAYRIRTSVDANAVRAPHGSTHAFGAGRHESVSVAKLSRRDSRIALMVSSARNARPSNHAGVLTYARGPPQLPTNREPHRSCLSAIARLRMRSCAQHPSCKPTNKNPGWTNPPGLSLL
jgi:hypothetical protein